MVATHRMATSRRAKLSQGIHFVFHPLRYINYYGFCSKALAALGGQQEDVSVRSSAI